MDSMFYIGNSPLRNERITWQIVKKRCSFRRLRLVKKQRAGDVVSEKPTAFLRSCGENQHPGADPPRRKTGNALKLEIVVKNVLNEKMEQASRKACSILLRIWVQYGTV